MELIFNLNFLRLAPAMVVCQCRGIRARQIRRLVRQGAQSPLDVARRTGAGAACGGCRVAVAEIVARENALRARRERHASDERTDPLVAEPAAAR